VNTEQITLQATATLEKQPSTHINMGPIQNKSDTISCCDSKSSNDNSRKSMNSMMREHLKEWKQSRKFYRRQMNVRRFKSQFPECQQLKGKNILQIFFMYRHLIDHCKQDSSTGFSHSNGSRLSLSNDQNESVSIIFFILGSFLIVFSSIFRGGVAQGELSLFIQEDVAQAVYRNPLISITACTVTQIFIVQYQNFFQTGQSSEDEGKKSSKKDAFTRHSYSINQICFAMIAGFVSNTSSSGAIEPWGVVLIGIVGCFVFNWSSNLLSRFEIDDPLQASSINIFCGIWASVSRGILDKQNGLLYSGSSNLLSIQLITLAAVVAWTFSVAFLFFYSLNKQNLLRSSVVGEIIGDDLVRYGTHGQLIIDREALKKEFQKIKKLYKGESSHGLVD